MGKLEEPPEPKRKAGRFSRRDVVVAGHVGDMATARSAKSHADPATRASAYGALARMGALDNEDLTGALSDPSPKVRMRAITLAVGHPEAVGHEAPFTALLDDSCDEVVEVAAWACGEQEATAPSTVTRLGELATGHPNPLVREAAVAALGAVGDPDGLDAILAATTDRAAVRRRAILALAPFDGPEVESALRRAAKDRDRQTRDAAEMLIQAEFTP